MSDGAGAVVLMSEAAMKHYGLTPLGRFVGFAVAGVPPEIMGIGPVKAIPKALAQAGSRKDDIDWIELNEAFAAQTLAVIKDLGLDRDEGESARRRDRARPSARRDRRDAHGDARCTGCAGTRRSTAWSRCASAPAWARREFSKLFSKRSATRRLASRNIQGAGLLPQQLSSESIRGSRDLPTANLRQAFTHRGPLLYMFG